jgi:hypothetical protein
MTIPAGAPFVTTHIGNGVASTFDYQFKITDASDLGVIITGESTLVLGTDYTVVGVGDNGGGSITLTAGPLGVGKGLEIYDSVVPSQLVPFGNQGAFYGNQHENAFDKLTRLVKRALTYADDSLRLPSGTPLWLVSRILPAPVASKYLRWNASATAIEYADGTSASTSLGVIPQADVTQLWRKDNAGEQIYSTPIYVPGFSCTTFTGPVFIYQSWDWFIYVVKASDGATVWRYSTGDNCYGRAQYLELAGNQYIIGASHSGKVYCLDEEGALRWEFNNLYAREHTGTAVFNAPDSFTDVSKNWAENSFLNSLSTGTNNATITPNAIPGMKIKTCDGDTLTVYSPDGGLVDTQSYTYTITPRFTSDYFYQHAGTVTIESGFIPYLYVTGFDQQCVKINILTGAKVWAFACFNDIEPFPLVQDIDGDANLECVFTSVDSTMYVLNATTGALEGSISGTEGFDSFINSQTIKGDGTVYVVSGNRDGRVYSMNGTTKALDNKSTQFDALGGNAIDAGVTFYNNGDGTYNTVFNSDPGFIVMLDPEMNVVWRIVTRLLLNCSPQVATINGEQTIVVCDMAGGITFISATGTMMSQIHVRGRIEGTPYIADIDGDGLTEMMVNTLDGKSYLFRLNSVV